MLMLMNNYDHDRGVYVPAPAPGGDVNGRGGVIRNWLSSPLSLTLTMPQPPLYCRLEGELSHIRHIGGSREEEGDDGFGAWAEVQCRHHVLYVGLSPCAVVV
jgi:hypothetical protein